VTRRLQAALERPSHAYLFAGPVSVGKGTAARAFAAGLLCTARLPGQDACGRCSTCRGIAGEGHPDARVWELPEGEKTFKVERVRELITAVGRKPFSAPRQVHILAAFDAVQPVGANALLKTLEEPPPTSTLILLARDLDAVLPTLVSRCQVIRFGLTPPAVIAEVLTAQRGLPMARARALARAAEGRLGRALALAAAGDGPEPVVAPWPQPGAVHAFTDALAARPADVQAGVLDALLLHVADLARLAADPAAPAEALHHPEQREALGAQACRAPVPTWLALATQLEEARDALARSANARLVLDRLGRALAPYAG
jgi:DNA polymerase-3 subunit delta'